MAAVVGDPGERSRIDLVPAELRRGGRVVGGRERRAQAGGVRAPRREHGGAQLRPRRALDLLVDLDGRPALVVPALVDDKLGQGLVPGQGRQDVPDRPGERGGRREPVGKGQLLVTDPGALQRVAGVGGDRVPGAQEGVRGRPADRPQHLHLRGVRAAAPVRPDRLQPLEVDAAAVQADGIGPGGVLLAREGVTVRGVGAVDGAASVVGHDVDAVAGHGDAHEPGRGRVRQGPVDRLVDEVGVGDPAVLRGLRIGRTRCGYGGPGREEPGDGGDDDRHEDDEQDHEAGEEAEGAGRDAAPHDRDSGAVRAARWGFMGFLPRGSAMILGHRARPPPGPLARPSAVSRGVSRRARRRHRHLYLRAS